MSKRDNSKSIKRKNLEMIVGSLKIEKKPETTTMPSRDSAGVGRTPYVSWG